MKKLVDLLQLSKNKSATTTFSCRLLWRFRCCAVEFVAPVGTIPPPITPPGTRDGRPIVTVDKVTSGGHDICNDNINTCILDQEEEMLSSGQKDLQS